MRKLLKNIWRDIKRLFTFWEFVCEGYLVYHVHSGKLVIKDKCVPRWIRKTKFPYKPDVYYRFNGKNFLYKVEVTRPGPQGSMFVYKFYRKKRIR